MSFAARLKSAWRDPNGYFSCFFLAPTWKWAISIANIQKPEDQISYPQQCAVTLTGLIWTRFSTQIIPVNYNLMTVNAFMALTGLYQLQRKIRYDMEHPEVKQDKALTE
jgi:mitochondrial pyruvate carrier 2